MNISPLDIRKHEFKKTLRGYDPDEVMVFLDMVSIEFENFIRENSLLKEKAANSDAQLKKYRDIESTLRETLLSAQRAREETIMASKKQADVIIREAEVKAASIIEEGRRESSSLRSTFIELKIQKDSYLAKIKAMINAQMEILQQLTFTEEEILEKTISAPVVEDNKPSISVEPEPENSEKGNMETEEANLKDVSEKNSSLFDDENY